MQKSNIMHILMMVFITNELKGYSTSLPIIIFKVHHLLDASLKLKTYMLNQTLVLNMCFSPQQKQWKVAMQNEYKSFLQNKTCTLIDMPRNQKVIQCKWVFQMKTLA